MLVLLALVLLLLALVLYRHRLVLVLLAAPPTADGAGAPPGPAPWRDNQCGMLSQVPRKPSGTPAARPAVARPAAAAAARVEALPTGRRASGPGPCPKPCGPALWMRTLEGLSRVVDADASGLASWVLYRQRLVHCC